MTAFREFLEREISARRKRNPRYSLRAFSRDAGLESTTLSHILSGKRRVSAEKASEVLDRLGLDAVRRNSIVLSMLNDEMLHEIDDEELFHHAELPGELEASWLFFALLSSFELKGCQGTVDWFAARLGASKVKVGRMLKLMKACGYVKFSDGRWRLARYKNSMAGPTSNDPWKLRLRDVHSQYIEKAREHLWQENADLEAFDISGLTIAIDKTKLKEAKRRIVEFRRSLGMFLTDGEHHEVYRLNIQLFPLTHE